MNKDRGNVIQIRSAVSELQTRNEQENEFIIEGYFAVFGKKRSFGKVLLK